MADPLRVLELCAGLGAFSLGLRLALQDRMRVVGYAERQAYCAAVLLRRMEEQTLCPAPLWCGPLEDLRGGELRGRVDLITAGFPCQPWSGAGKRRGVDDERWLWPEIARLVREIEPAGVFLENVKLAAFEQPLDDLQGLGFEFAPPVRVAAEDVGAPHRRTRFFALAYTDRLARWLADVGDAGGARLEGTEHQRPGGRSGPADARRMRAVADADGRRCEGERLAQHGDEQGEPGREPLRCGADGGFPRPWPPGRGSPQWAAWPEETQPGFPGGPDGPAVRVERLHALGNGLVPSVAAAAWEELTMSIPKEAAPA